MGNLECGGCIYFKLPDAEGCGKCVNEFSDRTAVFDTLPACSLYQSIEHEPCPFCGQHKMRITVRKLNNGMYGGWAICENCNKGDAAPQIGVTAAHAYKLATRYWNAQVCGGRSRKVYVVNVNNCEPYEDYFDMNVGVFATREAAEDAMRAQGFDVKTRSKVMPWDGFKDDPDWRENGWYDEEEYVIQEWEVRV